MASTSHSPGSSSNPDVASDPSRLRPLLSVLRELKSKSRERSDLQAITPRMVLMDMILNLQSLPFSLPEKNSGGQKHTEFSQSYSVRDLTVQSLDIPIPMRPMDKKALVPFLTSLWVSKEKGPAGNLYSSYIKRCAVCTSQKFSAEPSSPSPLLRRLNEFPSTGLWSGKAARCSQSICSNCLSNAITTCLQDGLFHNLDRPMWLKCPVSGCDEFLPIAHVGDMANVLLRLGSQPGHVETQIATWQRATSVRLAITSCHPRPSVPALEVAAALHTHLVTRNVMKSFFDPCFPNRSTTPDEEGRLADFTPGPIKMLSIESKGGASSLLVPLFIKFLKRKPAAAARQCKGCLEWRCEIDYGSLNEWIETCRPFPGSWVWRVLVFPERLAAICRHKMDFCTECLVEYIKTTMNQNGCYSAGSIRCPSEGCGRKLSYDEIQWYVERETKERYDRFLHLQSISQLPNFRWCSRAGCDNGQTFEPEQVNEGLPVKCGECGFDMCFSHQVPWHQGMTCEEYDSCRGQGDPALNHTQRWMQQNVKTCPRADCGIPILKDDGCFHMTCPKCQCEFCWECLADFLSIYDRVTGVYHQGAHKEECFFRRHEITPLALDGSTLEQALDRMREDDEDEEFLEDDDHYTE